MSSNLAIVFEAKYSPRKLHPIPEEDAVSVVDSGVFSEESPFLGPQESLHETSNSSFMDLEELGFEVVLPADPKASFISNPEALQKSIKFYVEDEDVVLEHKPIGGQTFDSNFVLVDFNSDGCVIEYDCGQI
ncbi:hypothetical protein L596_000806 [Steinernema carpocapsae]|uniref:Uncharacterized protein n=1 Tax=Steinernema carpocapsae TaxID=34508 RepID=A0A4U8UJA8_STECR|nr:hypothetical protein L596_000806 [Steinernema carpocapsae]